MPSRWPRRGVSATRTGTGESDSWRRDERTISQECSADDSAKSGMCNGLCNSLCNDLCNGLCLMGFCSVGIVSQVLSCMGRMGMYSRGECAVFKPYVSRLVDLCIAPCRLECSTHLRRGAQLRTYERRTLERSRLSGSFSAGTVPYAALRR